MPKIARSSIWPDFKAWKEFGISHGFDQRNPTKIKDSKIHKARSWYNYGQVNRWLQNFDFQRKKIDPNFADFKAWKEHGLKREYDQRNTHSLRRSASLEDRSWIRFGESRKWIDDFNFLTVRFDWSDFDSAKWISYGESRRYDKRNARSISKSNDDKERSWYQKGADEGWLTKFRFTNLREKSKFENLDDWLKYGLEMGFDKRNPTSIAYGKSKEERAWYQLGIRKKWTKKFQFNRIRAGERDYERFLRNQPEAEAIINLATVTENTTDIANILVQLWPDRFPSASQLAKSLPGAVKRIGHSLHPFSMWKARGFYDSDFTVPREVRYALDDLLYSIAIDQYQTKFNQSPVRTINELRRFAVQRNGVKKLAQRVLKYYQGVYDFHIPGHGRLKEAV
tara:strand:- start:8869 stop:10053 length:1185 start_codon:yes stop_codon:yes gene_type:complete